MKSLVCFLFCDLCQASKNLDIYEVLKAQEWTGFGQESHIMPGKKILIPVPGFDFCSAFVPALSPVTLQRWSFSRRIMES